MRDLRFLRAVHADNALRGRDRRSAVADALRQLANRGLQPLERRLARRYRDPERPLVFIVGCPRSGTTLVHQLAATWLDVAYVSNHVARWWLAPVWAARRAGRGPARGGALRSDLGRTDGDRAPHEFGWFWQYHTGQSERGFRQSDCLTDAELEAIDWEPLALELQGLAGWWGAPLVLKNLNHTAYHVAWLARRFPRSRFVHVRRDPRFCARSILEARLRRYGDERVWWSIRPRDVDAWRDRTPEEQVCHQVRDVRDALERGRTRVAADRWLDLDYETLIESPADALRAVGALSGATLRDPGELERLVLKSANESRCAPERFARLEELLA